MQKLKQQSMDVDLGGVRGRINRNTRQQQQQQQMQQ